jgi:hypothetical protein
MLDCELTKTHCSFSLLEFTKVKKIGYSSSLPYSLTRTVTDSHPRNAMVMAMTRTLKTHTAQHRTRQYSTQQLRKCIFHSLNSTLHSHTHSLIAPNGANHKSNNRQTSSATYIRATDRIYIIHLVHYTGI